MIVDKTDLALWIFHPNRGRWVMNKPRTDDSKHREGKEESDLTGCMWEKGT